MVSWLSRPLLSLPPQLLRLQFWPLRGPKTRLSHPGATEEPSYRASVPLFYRGDKMQLFQGLNSVP